jgi:hypothetical protein
MGLQGPYYTIMNTELRFIHIPLLFALIPTIIIGLLLWWLTRRGTITWPRYITYSIIGAIYLLAFLLFASMTWVVY